MTWNPHPCGFLDDVKRECTCSSLEIQRYRTKVSGPLLDRIDLHLEVPAVPYRELSGVSEGEPSHLILEKVVSAREIQKERFSRTKILNNASMNSRHLKKFFPVDSKSSLLRAPLEHFLCGKLSPENLGKSKKA